MTTPYRIVVAGTVYGNIISNTGTVDPRWVRIRRPTVVVGGELTMTVGGSCSRCSCGGIVMLTTGGETTIAVSPPVREPIAAVSTARGAVRESTGSGSPASSGAIVANGADDFARCESSCCRPRFDC